MKIISVIPLKKTVFKGDLTYFSNLEIKVGDIVSVPIRIKETLALVTSVEELKEAKSDIKGMNFNLRKVTKNKGPSVFSPEFLDSVFDTGKYFAQNKNSSTLSLIPSIFIEKYDRLAKITNALNKEKVILENKLNIRAEKLLLQYPLEDRISIYKTLVRESFARNKSVFLVLPTEFDIEKFGDQLKKGIEQFTFTLHSGLNPKKNISTCEKILESSHPILIIGTPPFLSVPKRDIGVIILEHESSNAYNMFQRPYFDLRIFAEIYASKINAKFILADELLRFETISRKDSDNLNSLHPLSFRIDSEQIIKFGEKKSKEQNNGEKGAECKFQILSDQSIEEIKLALGNKKNVFIFSLRKGLATMTICKNCGDTLSCEKCGAPLVLYTSHQGKKRMFVCNRCQVDLDGDIVCRSCQSWNLLPLGIGTDTVYEEAERLFPEIKIFKLDKESARTSQGAKKIIKEFEGNAGAILIGTEMSFFYLKNKVPLSIIASFDSLWNIPNFRMNEKIIQLILSLLQNTSGSLIIQTKNENNSALLAIKSGNLLSFIREELEDRKKMSYPPFKRFIKITYLGDKEQTVKSRKMLEEIFKEYSPEIFSGFVERLKGKYLTNTLIKMDTKKWSLPALSLNGSIDEDLLAKLTSLPLSFEIFVDPEDLL